MGFSIFEFYCGVVLFGVILSFVIVYRSFNGLLRLGTVKDKGSEGNGLVFLVKQVEGGCGRLLWGDQSAADWASREE